MTQTITAMYDDQADAQAAMSKLITAGIPQSAIKLVPGAASTTPRSTGSHDRTRDEGSFWSSLKEVFLPEEDHHTYTEGLSRGSTMLSASVESSQVDTAMDIMEQHGSVDLDEREATWRQEGWTGYGTISGPGTAVTGSAAGSAAGLAATDGTGAGATSQAGTARATSGQSSAGRDENIPVAEEQLRVGKRVAQAGRVRVRSYVVETPVQEQVALRDEQVHVERRPVDRAPTAADERLFAERTIEATERAEEAVVSKDVRVKEEIGLRKEVEQRTETVSDKVRRTEVEIEDERGQVTRTGTTDTTNPNRGR
ncbi:YsnF/AvaK domain-containing protein [Methylobacterium oryzisoli]|uniref:YsnF/AvaK domain-containing protein n=1 Tax=Methylobacterium oryzisoli TaxID=3385502 RepID=UPI003891F153